MMLFVLLGSEATLVTIAPMFFGPWSYFPAMDKEFGFVRFVECLGSLDKTFYVNPKSELRKSDGASYPFRYFADLYCHAA